MEYDKEMRNMQLVFKTMVERLQSKHITDENVLAKEKHEALKVNEYKELYKMEKIKREEEEHNREYIRQEKLEEHKKQEKQEALRQEKLFIETEKTIAQKEKQFKLIQKETLLQKVEDLPGVMDYYTRMENFLEGEIGSMQH